MDFLATYDQAKAETRECLKACTGSFLLVYIDSNGDFATVGMTRLTDKYALIMAVALRLNSHPDLFIEDGE